MSRRNAGGEVREHDSRLQHGSGVRYTDTSNGYVVKLTYTAYVLPPHASSGSVTEIGRPGVAGSMVRGAYR